MPNARHHLDVTLARVRDWSRLFHELEELLERLQGVQDRPLGRALAWMIERCVDGGSHLRGEPVDAEPPTLERMAGLLLRGRAPQGRRELQLLEELELLLNLARACLEDAAEGGFSVDPSRVPALVQEYHSLQHLDAGAGLPLLPPAMAAAWQESRTRPASGSPGHELRRDLCQLHLARSLYALAIGIPTFPEQMTLAHQLGESLLQPSVSRSPNRGLLTVP